MSLDDFSDVGHGNTLIDTSHASENITDLEKRINARIIGQSRAVRMVAQSLEIEEAGLVEPGMPAAILFFAGPPGVGKTELAFVLAEEWIGKLARKPGTPIISPATVIDCTFFQSPHDVANLKGSTKGYVGYRDEVPLHQRALDRYHVAIQKVEVEKHYLRNKVEWLTRLGKLQPKEKVDLSAEEREWIENQIEKRKKRPKKVLLFDEVTRAHSSLAEFLISMMNGKPIAISDGTMTDLSRTVLIMTSNINEGGIQDIISGRKRGIGLRPPSSPKDEDPNKRDQDIYESTKQEIERSFPAPFVSRIKKGIVVFRPFNEEDWLKIIDLRLGEVSSMFRVGNVEKRPVLFLRFTPECKKLLLKQGIDAKYGARPLRETVRKYLHVPLARILNDDSVDSGDTLIFDRDNDRIVVYKENPSAPSE